MKRVSKPKTKNCACGVCPTCIHLAELKAATAAAAKPSLVLSAPEFEARMKRNRDEQDLAERFASAKSYYLRGVEYTARHSFAPILAAVAAALTTIEFASGVDNAKSDTPEVIGNMAVAIASAVQQRYIDTECAYVVAAESAEDLEEFPAIEALLRRKKP